MLGHVSPNLFKVLPTTYTHPGLEKAVAWIEINIIEETKSTEEIKNKYFSSYGHQLESEKGKVRLVQIKPLCKLQCPLISCPPQRRI